MSNSTTPTDLTLSPLAKSWIIDLDGTVLIHNGHLKGADTVIPSSKTFLDSIPKNDKIIFVTSRTEEYKDETISTLKNSEIRFDNIIFSMPMGERILINDAKPSGLKTAYAINTERDKGIFINIIIDDDL